MLKRLLRPTAFKVALAIGLVFASVHLLRRLGVVHLGYLQTLEDKAIDWKFRLRGELPLSHRVALAEIDEHAVQEYGLWPWNRALVGRAIDKLVGAGASAVAVDLVFSDPDRNSAYGTLAQLKGQLGGPEESLPDQAQAVLAKAPAAFRNELAPVIQAALREHQRLSENRAALERTAGKSPDAEFRALLDPRGDDVVLGTILRDSTASQQFSEAVIQGWVEELKGSVIPGAFEVFRANPRALPHSGSEVGWRVDRAEAIEAWLPALVGSGKHFGYFSLTADSDGTLRRYAPVTAYREGFFPALAIAAAARASHSEVFPIRSAVTPRGLDAVGVFSDASGFIQAPVDAFGGAQLLINYPGPKSVWRKASEAGRKEPGACVGSGCDRLSVADVLDGKFDPAVVKDKVVFLGVTALGTFDQRVTPFDTFIPGVYVHMAVAESLVSQRFIENGAYLALVETALLLLVALLFGLVLPRVRFSAQLAMLPVGLGSYFGANVYAFGRGVQLFTFTPLLEISLLVFGMVFFQYVTTDREKRQVRDAFKYYLTESVMTEMLKDPSKLKLGGEKKQLTVLFSDIRGFTTLSEMLEASEVARTLNEYLTPMTNLVFERGGTLDKYMGDAIMAFWGAPVDQPDHALRACQTACAMLERLDAMRAEWRAKGRPDIDIGIGLNSGLIHVGNMGSDIRFDYTVIGDDVNLASRLEGTNKSYGTRVIIGENTFAQVKGQVVARELGGVVVKGKRKPVTIYELRRVGAPTPQEAEAIAAFERGLGAYRARDWDGAEAAFRQVQAIWPGDGPAEKYLDDLAEKRTHPPDSGWDGVYVMKTK